MYRISLMHNSIIIATTLVDVSKYSIQFGSFNFIIEAFKGEFDLDIERKTISDSIYDDSQFTIILNDEELSKYRNKNIEEILK